ncbi:hypothetical protein JTB14_006472 [Gonioctena quinquepunctata]|nr:hypothetical protein JTB14_006472 [Gonioctena quinquepunctata]
MQSSSRASDILEMAKSMKEDNINESKNVTNKNVTEDAKPEIQVISVLILNNESDIDDSDKDSDFQDCSSNSSDSSPDSSSSGSDEESDHVIVQSTGVRDKTQVQATMEEGESTKDNSNILAECNQDKENEQNSHNIDEKEESRQNARGIQVALENQELPKKGKKRQNNPEFWATLDHNDRPIRTALSKKTDNGFLEPDGRGKHGHQPTVDPEIKESIKTFINSIPRIESHYLRAQTTREFIESSKCLADLYRDYREEREKANKCVAPVSMFNRIFRNEFNISFFVPKEDQCDLCETFKNSDEEKKILLRPTYDQHQREKEMARIEKKIDKDDINKPHVIVYDLQAVMPVLKGHASSFYYKSKLNCINITICDSDLKNVDCYFWDETQAKHGSIEIGSCVLQYLNSLQEIENITNNDVIIYSDNCCGQQKNKYILSAYAYAMNKPSKINSITHKFLMVTTTKWGDNVHSVIEKQVKMHLKSSPIYTPQQYSTLIRA